MESVRWTGLCLQVALVITALCAVVSADTHNDTVWCYKCNSGYDGPACTAEESVGQLQPFLGSCGVADPPFTRCRTMVQTVEGETRTIRSCATAGASDADRCMDRVGTVRVKVRYCECPGELVAERPAGACNEARGVTSLSALTSLAVMTSLALIASRRV